MDYKHVDENVCIRIGKDAQEAFEKENDISFLDDEHGIIKVSKERWTKAQNAEKYHQVVLGATAGDDRNYDHYELFNQYQTLAGLRFEHAIELGCGPFTNLRLIADCCWIGQCDLLDPLINDYVGHKHCSFSNEYLRAEIFRLTSLPYYKVIKKIVKKLHPLECLLRRTNKIPIGKLIGRPIEEMSADACYDLIVMVNVIEHCYDIGKIFKSILSASKPGTVFVFNDKCYKPDITTESSKTRYDAAHPLKVDGKLIKNFLSSYFEELFNREIESTAERTDLYYIGERK